VEKVKSSGKMVGSIVALNVRLKCRAAVCRATALRLGAKSSARPKQ
jgi:hypothetical protein